MSDRKYSHRGYQDSGDRERGKGATDDVRRKLEGSPRGRSVGLDANAVFKCNACGERILSLEDVKPDSTCSQCKASLHSCSHCSHYDPAARWECKEPIPERIPKKTTANECGLFAPRVTLDLTGSKPASPGDARSAFDRLFKK